MAGNKGCVTVTGIAREAKVGPLVEYEGGTTWVGLECWPDDVLNKKVRVTGMPTVVSDLPVFVRREGEPEKSGIPVSTEADLEEASKRTVLKDVKWELVDE